MFIDGVIGVCRNCGGEVEYLKHVFQFKPSPTDILYQVKHTCGATFQAKGNRKDSRAIISWLKWRNRGETEREYSEEEYYIAELAAELTKINDDNDIRATFG